MSEWEHYTVCKVFAIDWSYLVSDLIVFDRMAAWVGTNVGLFFISFMVFAVFGHSIIRPSLERELYSVINEFNMVDGQKGVEWRATGGFSAMLETGSRFGVVCTLKL